MTAEHRSAGGSAAERSGQREAVAPSQGDLFLRLFIEKAAVGIILTDEAGRIREWNPGAERLTGIPRARAVDQPVWEVQAALLAAGESVVALAESSRLGILDALRTGVAPWLDTPAERSVRRADGVEIAVEQRLFLVPTPRGSCLGAVLVDATEHRRADRLLALQRDLGLALAGTGDLREGLSRALDVVLQIEGVDAGGVYQVDSDAGSIDLVASVGISDDYAAQVTHYDRTSPEWRIISNGSPYYGPDDRVGMVTEEAGRREGILALANIPILVEGRVVASLALASHSVPAFSPAARSAAEAIATQVGSVLVRIEAQRSLRDVEERYRILVEDIAEGAGFVEPDQRFAVANSAAESIFGVLPGGLVGRSLAEFTMPESLAEVARQRELRQAGQRSTYEMGIVRPDGQRRSIVVKAAPHYDPGGTFDGTIGVFSDVTDQRRAEQALRESEVRFRTLFEHAGDAIVIHDEEGRVLEANQLACERLGYSHDELLGMTTPEIDAPEYAPQLDRVVDQLRRTGSVVFETAHVRKDGERVPVEVNARRVEIDGQRLYLSASRDLTERKRAEVALRQREADLRRAQEIAAVGSWTSDFRTGEMLATDELRRILGLAADEVIEMDAVLLMALPEDRPKLLAAMDEVRRSGSGAVEARLRRADGTIVDARVGVEIERDGSGERLRMVGTVQDITERRRAEEERRALEAQVQQAQKMESLGVLAGGIAHDFNNMLVGILGNAGIVRAALPPASPLRETVEDIEVAAQRAADLAGQMLAYSGRGRFVVDTLDLNQVVSEMGRLLGASVSKGVLLQYVLAPDLPGIVGDVTQLRQVIMNLITNASDAIGDTDGVITCRTGTVVVDHPAISPDTTGERLEPGTYVSLSVTDTGAGMDRATRARIFEPFFTTRFTGRGLGLAAVLGILRGHRGTISVGSTPGKGSTFTVLLPVAPAPVSAASDAAAAGSQADPPAPDRRTAVVPGAADEPGHRDLVARVLVVDDEASVRRLAGRVLERAGYEVRVAADGVEALAIIRADPATIDIVLLDLSMPRLAGDKAFAALREVRADLPILLTSGFHDRADLLRASGVAAGFLRKPYSPEDLVDAVAGALAATQRRAGE